MMLKHMISPAIAALVWFVAISGEEAAPKWSVSAAWFSLSFLACALFVSGIFAATTFKRAENGDAQAIQHLKEAQAAAPNAVSRHIKQSVMAIIVIGTAANGWFFLATAISIGALSFAGISARVRDFRVEG